MSKTLQELRREPHTSISALNTYMGCSLKYRFRYVDKLDAECQSPNLVLGSAVHKAMELFYLAKQEDRHVEDKDLVSCVEDYIRGVCRPDRAEIRFKEGENLNTLIEQGKDLIRCFLDNVPEESSRIISVEQPFKLEIRGLPVPVIGAFDLLLEDDDGTITIVDNKTAARAMADRDLHWSNMQLVLYQMAVKTNGFEDREIILRFDTLIKTKTPRFEQFYTTRTDSDELRLVRKFQEVHRAIKAGVFLPNDSSWMCSNCEYQTACKDWAASTAA